MSPWTGCQLSPGMGLGEDVAYVAILLGSIGLGPVVRAVPQPNRKAVSTVLGLAIAALVSGAATLHLLAQAAGNIAILHLLPPRHCHLASFTWCFSYLLFFRDLLGVSSSLGLPQPPPHTNAIILILTLKLVGLAFEVHDKAEERERRKIEREDRDNEGEEKGEVLLENVPLVPSVADQVHYVFNHVGLITGPYYRYSTWCSLHCSPWAATPGECLAAAKSRAARVPGYVLAFLASGYLFPLSVVTTPEWQAEHGALYKAAYMMPVFLNFRMRIYAGFVLSEVSCIMAGLGAYPVSSRPRPGQGPTVGRVEYEQGEKLNFETVHNIDEWGADFTPTMRQALKCWNMTVQHWLVFVVYKRFPVKALRTLAVMVVSSVWHGVHPGYYLGLCSVPLCLPVEDLWRARVRDRLGEGGRVVYDWLSWFVRMRWFDYLGMAFLLLRIDATWTYWTSVYFVGHLSLPLLYSLALALGPLLDRLLGPRHGARD